jgi:hypothetical protein
MSPRRYTHDNLVYESFYTAIFNSLFVALAPALVFLICAIADNIPVTFDGLSSFLGLTHLVFMVSFFVNFLYYVYFVRKHHRLLSYFAAVVITAGGGFFLFSDEYGAMFSETANAVIVMTWFLILVMLMIAHRIGAFSDGDRDARYEEESWLYKHTLARAGGTADDAGEVSIEDVYTPHKYINHHDENAPDLPKPALDPENDPKRASRLT